MRISRVTPAVFVLITALAFAQSAPSAKPAAGFSIDNIDKTVDPCVDFFQYACGNWIKNSEIPADRSSWVSFVELDERNLDIERGILEKAAAGGAGRSAVDQKIGDLYGSCMDEKAVDAKGIAPLKPMLDRVAAAKDKGALIDEIARLHLAGTNALFNFSSGSDLHNSDQVIAYIDQGGLTLPDRDYYIKDDADKVEMRKKFLDYATELFTLAGQSAQQATDSAQTVLLVETQLAADSMDRTKRRDPKNRDHKMTRDEAVALAPQFDLNRYFTTVGAPAFTELNVTNPDFFRQVNGALVALSLESMKTYVTWHVLRSSAPWLSQPFVEANFKLRQALTGQKQIQDRWKRCVDLVDGSLGEALGQRYVDLTFGADGKQRMLKMVDALETSLDQDIQHLDWMSGETKKQAKVKLEAIRNKIGYPEMYRDYSSITIKRTICWGTFAARTNLNRSARLPRSVSRSIAKSGA
jgi:putative endopeptidase